MAKLLIFLSLLFPLFSSQCPAELYSNSIVTTTLKLVSIGSSSTYTHSFQNHYSQPPQITFSIINLQLDLTEKYSFTSFWLIPVVSTSDLKLVSTGTISSLRVSSVRVIMSTNGQLLLDLVFAEVQSFVGLARVQFKLNSNNGFSSSTNLIIRTFLAGLNATSSIPFLVLGGSSLQNNLLSLSLQVNTQFSFFLMVSVAIFPQQSNYFAIYGSTASISGPKIKILDLFQSLTASQSIYYGINGLNIGAKAQSISFSADIGSDFILNMTASEQVSFQLSYFFLGNSAKQVCSKCQLNGLGYIYYDGNCLQNCPPLTIEVTVDGSKLCRGCPSALNLGFSEGKCVQCDKNSIPFGGQCVPKLNSFQSQLSFSSQNNFTSVNTFQSISNPSNSNGINQIILPSIQIQTRNNSQSSVSSAQSIKQPTQDPSQNPTNTLTISNPQCPLPYMYWNGDQCVCIVGYAMVANICAKIFIPNFNTSSVCPGQYQYFDGQSCNCLPSYFYLNGICTNCPPNSIFNGKVCVCNQGYILNNLVCTPNKTNTCPPNSTDNGKGQCICSQNNYTLINSTCQPINCGTLKVWNGSACVCYSNTSTTSNCDPRCPPGQQWSSSTQSCFAVCGLNMRYDFQQLKCICIDGFAIGMGGECQQCPGSYFSLNGYCVTCPKFATMIGGNCVCQSGYKQMPDGTCQQICTSLEDYNPTTGQCECLNGLARINSVCGICPSNSFLRGGVCISCGSNAKVIGGKCICDQGFIADLYGVMCLPCDSQNNTFLLNGFCVKCPYRQIYNNLTAQCSCPSGTILSPNGCIPACRVDESLDSSGNCFSCGANMVLSGNQCVCAKGYVPAKGCGCQLSCANNQFQYRGICAQCPLNTIYMPAIQGCVCPNGYYWSNNFNLCLQTPFLATQCNLGQYLDKSTNKCVNCDSTCINCTQTSCVQCVLGYQPTANASVCQSICGDGYIVGNETCDSGSVQQQGCQACKVVPGYSCSGRPSVCKLDSNNSNNNNNSSNNSNNSNNSNTTQSDSLQLKLAPQINTNNIFVTLITTPTFNFTDPAAMKSFIQVSFANNVKPTVYCVQDRTPSLFNCLLIYPNGVPNIIFNVTFSYNYQGHTAKLTVQINTLVSQNTLSSRSF